VKRLFGVLAATANWIWRAIFIFVLLTSVAFNIAALVGGGLYTVVSSAVESVTGIRTLAGRHVDQVAALSSELQKQKNKTTDLETDLSRKNQRIASLNNEIDEARVAWVVTYRNQQKFLTEAVEDTSQRISQRTVNRSARNVAAVFAESIPVVGVGIVVAVTGLELRDSCNTLKDLGTSKNCPDHPAGIESGGETATGV